MQTKVNNQGRSYDPQRHGEIVMERVTERVYIRPAPPVEQRSTTDHQPIIIIPPPQNPEPWQMGDGAWRIVLVTLAIVVPALLWLLIDGFSRIYSH